VGVFGVVLAVNLVFMFSAIRTFTGLETEHAYDKGLAYNDVIAKTKAQERLGWQVEAQVIPHDGNTDTVHDADLVVTFADKDGKPVSGLSVKAEVVRPTKDGFDQTIDLQEQGGGRYVAPARLALGGQWDVHFKAHRGEVDYQLNQRVLVP
jgi:nitrogen fixation protein FixH